MIVFYHGGGFVVGGLDTHDEVVDSLRKYAKVQVLSIDYPLAPEASHGSYSLNLVMMH